MLKSHIIEIVWKLHLLGDINSPQIVHTTPGAKQNPLMSLTNLSSIIIIIIIIVIIILP